MSLLQNIYDYIKSGETSSHNLGLEIEHFVVDENGVQIGFNEVTALIDRIGKETGAEIVYSDGYPVGYVNEHYTISIEPSCQFEISINPYSDLSAIENVYREFLNLWEPIFGEKGYHIVTKGNLPSVELGITDPDTIPLSPKKRYQLMDAYFRNSGKYGKYMMRASAATQISIDYSSEADLIRKLLVLQKISPILMIMMENKTDEKSTLPEETEKPHLLRIQEWDNLDPDRTGFYPHSLDPDFGYKEIANVVYHAPLILLTDNGATTDVGQMSAADLVDKGVLKEADLNETRRMKLTEHFLSMGFYHFRIKKFIEIRVADSVPMNKALAFAALIKGIVYSNLNLSILDDALSEIDTTQKIQEAVIKIEKDGFEAVIYRNETAAQWADRLVQLAYDSLPEQEKRYLAHV